MLKLPVAASLCAVAAALCAYLLGVEDTLFDLLVGGVREYVCMDAVGVAGALLLLQLLVARPGPLYAHDFGVVGALPGALLIQ